MYLQKILTPHVRTRVLNLLSEKDARDAVNGALSIFEILCKLIVSTVVGVEHFQHFNIQNSTK